jgi:hypothetical protein
MGYTLLAEVVARVGGQPFPDWLEENVFVPLGMASTHMHDDHEHVVPGRAYSYRGSPEQGWRNAVLSYANAGATSLFTTAGDLARWLTNLETAELGGRAVVEQMRERGVLTSGETISYAFALMHGNHNGRTTWSHGGSDAGFRSMVLHFPEERLGVVVLSNAASFNPARLAAQVADIYLDDAAGSGRVAVTPVVAPTSAPAGPVVIDPRLLEAYTGEWEVEGLGVFQVRRDGATLMAEVTGRRIAMVAESQTTFRADVGRIRFLGGLTGVDRVVVESGGQEWLGRRVPPSLGAAELASYAGDYFSPELETLYRIAVVGDRLVARHVRHGELALTPAEVDVFRGSQWFFGRVVFTRDSAGAIDGFRASGSRVRDLRFMRLADGALPR